MRKRNWKMYNRQLVQRGSITFLVDPKIFRVRKAKGMGRPMLFSDSLILMLMMTKVHHRLPYRSLQGFAESMFEIAKITRSIPTYSAICKRAKRLRWCRQIFSFVSRIFSAKISRKTSRD
ncbi:MAG: transposase [Chlamydiales bacterium]|nr:transposase [Chlamydiales bacterium]